MTWQAHIKIGNPAAAGVEFLTTGPSHNSVADDLNPLTGLQFGWTSPVTGIYPIQPTPMTCSLEITSPDFHDDTTLSGSGITERDPVVVELWLDVGADPGFGEPDMAFYGRVTDVTATPRRGRPGVVLAIAAVDYLADWSEYPTVQTTHGDDHSDEIVDDVWNDLFGSSSPFPTELDGKLVTAITTLTPPLQAIDEGVLKHLPVFGTAPDGDYRYIVTPRIGVDDGLLNGSDSSETPDTADWSIDKVVRPGSHIAGTDILAGYNPTPVYISAPKVDRGIKWVKTKGRAFARVEVTGWGGVSTNVAVAELTGRPAVGRVNFERFTTPLQDVDDATAAAQFYLPLDANADGWSIDRFRWRVDEEDPLAANVAAQSMFPRLTRTPPDVNRAGCYGLSVAITGIPGDVNPYADDATVIGSLASASVSISSRGRLAIEGSIRQTLATVGPEDPG